MFHLLDIVVEDSLDKFGMVSFFKVDFLHYFGVLLGENNGVKLEIKTVAVLFGERIIEVDQTGD